MKHLAAIAPLLAVWTSGGCFYVDPINQRPSIAIVNPSSDAIGRGQKDVTLQSVVDDPDDQFVRLHWRMYICDDAADFATCDQAPASESSNPSFTFDAPIHRADNTTPASSLLVDLEGVDELGATARPSQQLIIPLADGKPTLDVRHVSAYQSTVNTPIDVFVIYGDPDDTAADVTLSYQLFTPQLSSATLSDLCTAGDPMFPDCFVPLDTTKKEQGRRFTPDAVGEWKVEVTAVDPLGAMANGSGEGTTTTTYTINVKGDEAPCLGLLDPLVPPAGAALPLSDPELFQVLSVDDALDPYPTNVADPILSAAQFRWSIKVNAAARQTLDTETGNLYAFDPAAFTPGDIVEVRAEVADRSHGFPVCADDLSTCEDHVGCLQRQTWTVEVH